MGAYGSPDLNEQNQKYQPYQGYQPPNQQTNSKGCLRDGIVILCVLIIIFCLFIIVPYLGGSSPQAAYTLNQNQVYSPPQQYNYDYQSSITVPQYSYSSYDVVSHYAPSVSSNVSSAPEKPTLNTSEEYMKRWVISVVPTCLIYPQSAIFSYDSKDWQFQYQGKNMIVTSFVNAKGKSGKMGYSDFVVKISYDDLNAKITYVSIGEKICYDASKSKTK